MARGNDAPASAAAGLLTADTTTQRERLVAAATACLDEANIDALYLFDVFCEAFGWWFSHTGVSILSLCQFDGWGCVNDGYRMYQSRESMKAG
jgi:hypothetical protein